MPISNSTLSRSLRIDYRRTALDTTQCAAFTEVLVTDPRSPHQIATQLHIDTTTGKLTKIDSIVTTTGDFFFQPNHTLHHTLRESWGFLAPGQRDSRVTLQAAAGASYDVFTNKSVRVP